LEEAKDLPSSAKLTPYLARALMGFEGTGRFFASDCGVVVQIIHGSLGRSDPRPTRRPVIVFLSHRPDRAYAGISVAE